MTAETRSMRILFACGREPSYPRNDVLLRALGRLGAVEAVTDSQPGSLVSRSLRVMARLLPRLAGGHDLIFIGFYGHLLMLPVGTLSHRPVAFDAFVSNYDTLCFDRAHFSPQSPLGRLAFWLDQTTCQRADHILLDTALHADYFAETFNLPPTKLRALPVGCNEDLFHPRDSSFPTRNATRVLYYCNYLPLHGVETVVRAAALLRSEPHVHFRLIGQGQDYTAVRRLATEMGLQNITFALAVPLDKLPAEIASAEICLGGHFGRSAKAGRVIPGKIYQMLAMARPVIAADTPANRSLLSHGQSAYLCPPTDPEALAAAILTLHRDAAFREYLASAGHELYVSRCSETIITAKLRGLLREMLG